jgi:PAS domain S-box-containing protein
MTMGRNRIFDGHSFPAQSLLEAIPSGVVLIDDHGVIGDLNQRLADMTGYELADLIGKDIELLMPKREGEGTFEAIAGHQGIHHSPRDSKLTVMRRDGRELPSKLLARHSHLTGIAGPSRRSATALPTSRWSIPALSPAIAPSSTLVLGRMRWL